MCFFQRSNCLLIIRRDWELSSARAGDNIWPHFDARVLCWQKAVALPPTSNWFHSSLDVWYPVYASFLVFAASTFQYSFHWLFTVVRAQGVPDAPQSQFYVTFLLNVTIMASAQRTVLRCFKSVGGCLMSLTPAGVMRIKRVVTSRQQTQSM